MNFSLRITRRLSITVDAQSFGIPSMNHPLPNFISPTFVGWGLTNI